MMIKIKIVLKEINKEQTNTHDCSEIVRHVQWLVKWTIIKRTKLNSSIKLTLLKEDNSGRKWKLTHV